MAANRVSAGSSRILIFIPPPLCLDPSKKKPRLEDKDHFAQWKRTEFRFDGATFVPDTCTPCRGTSCTNTVSESTDGSCIFLEYDPKVVQESVQFYLDSEFVERNFRKETLYECKQDCGLQREFELVNAASQRLLQESAPRSFSPQRGRRQNEISQDTHQLTEEDVYTYNWKCSADLSDSSLTRCSNDSPITPKKRTATVASIQSLSLSLGKLPMAATSQLTTKSAPVIVQPMADKVSSMTSLSSSSSSNLQQHIRSSSSDDTSSRSGEAVSGSSSSSKVIITKSALPKIYDKLSPLLKCTTAESSVNIVIVVLQVNPVREIQIKSGMNAGQYVLLSSIIVADDTKSSFKITLWREASKWTERILAGDFIVATSIRIEKWRNEYIGQTTYRSSFYNLHKPEKLLSSEWLRLVSQEQLNKLMSWAISVHGYLFNKIQSGRLQPKYTRVSDMQDNTLVHFRGRLEAVNVLTDPQSKKGYTFGHQKLPKIVAALTGGPNENINLCLWGRQADWMDDMRSGVGAVWEIEYLTVKYDTEGGIVTLHTTPKSTRTKLKPDNETARELLASLGESTGKATTFKNTKELLEAQFNGVADIQGHLSTILFKHGDIKVLRVENMQDIEHLESECHHLIYVGCGTCSRSLTQDNNGIYGQCAHCLYNELRYNYTISHFFRPITIVITDSNGAINVNVPSRCAIKLFNGIQARQLSKVNRKGENSPAVKKFVNTVRELVSCSKEQQFTLSCSTVLDENGFVLQRNFTLYKT